MKKIVLGALLIAGLAATAHAQATYSRAARPATAHFLPPNVARAAAFGDEMQQAIRQNWRGTIWRDTTRQLYPRYDAAHNNLERIVEDKNAAGAWARRNRRTNTYNAQNLRVQDTIFSNLGNPIFAYKRTYVTTGKPDTIRVLLRLGGTWRNASRDYFEYDASGFPVSQMQQNNAGGWYNFARILYSTDAVGRITFDEEQRFNDNTGAWDPSSLLEYSYTVADSLETAVLSEWNDSTMGYEVVGRSRYSYNAAGLRDSIYNEPYDLATTSYSLASVAVYEYDARGNRLSETVKIGADLASLTNLSKWVYSYRIATGVAMDALAGATLSIAPNPAASQVEMRYELPNAATVAVEITDLLGRCVATPLTTTTQAAGSQLMNLDVRALPAGLYIVRLTTVGASRQVKLVVE